MKHSCLLLLLSLFPFCTYAQQTLEPVEGVYGATVNCMYTGSNGTTFIGTNGGIYALNPETEAWEMMSNGIIFSGWQARIHDIVEVKGVLLAASEYLPGIYRSTDFGANWEIVKIYRGEFEVGYVKSFSYPNREDENLVYACSNSTLYKSTDGGNNWAVLPTNYSGMGAPMAVSEDGELFCGSGGSGLSLFKASLENDTIWEFFQASFESGAHTQIVTYGADTVFTIWAGYDGSHVVLQSRSNGDGGSWEPLKAPFGADSANIVLIKVDQEQNLWAFSGAGNVHRSEDGGRTWRFFEATYPNPENKSANIRRTDLENAAPINIVSTAEISRQGSQDIQVLIGSLSGVHVGKPASASPNTSINLRGINRNLRDITIVDGVYHNGVVYGMDARGGIFTSSESLPAKVFEQIDVLHDHRSMAIHPITNGLMVGGYDGLAMLNDKQLERIEIVGMDDANISAITYGTGETPKLYAGYNVVNEGCQIAVSDDNGQTWDNFAQIDQFYEPSCLVEYNGKLAASSTGSASIAYVDLENPADVSYELASTGNWSGFDVLLTFQNRLIASGWDGLSIKDSPEDDFRRVYQYVPESRNYLNDFDISGGKFYGTFSQGISEYNVTDNTWNKLDISYGLLPLEVLAVIVASNDNFEEKSAAITPPTLYVSLVNGGLWRVSPGAQTSVQEVQETKKAAIFPNPAKGQATVFFRLNHTQQVRIQVYAMNGKLVKTLASDELSAGSYRYALPGGSLAETSLPSGQYVVHIAIGAHQESHKFVYLSQQ